MLHIAVPPDRSGLDSFSPKTSLALCDAGIRSEFKEIWPRGIYDFWNSGRIPFGRRIFRQLLAAKLAGRTLRNIKNSDLVWILSFCVPLEKKPLVEIGIKQRGAKYLFHVMDDWFSFNFLKEGTIARCRLADCVGVPTPELAQRVREFVPEALVEVFEEPIDIDRLSKYSKKKLHETPVVLWCGNPGNISHIENVLEILRRLHKEVPFDLRVVSGKPPPKEFSFGLRLDWKCFDHEMESKLIDGSWFGIAPMPDSAHNRCKGAYKVKTYFGSGIGVVASPVGFQGNLVRESGGAGFLPDSLEDWENCLRRLLKDRTLAIQMGVKAQEYAEKRFSYRVVAKRWSEKLLQRFPPTLIA